MGPPPPRSVPPQRNNVQGVLESRRGLKMKDIQQFNKDTVMSGNGVGGGSAQSESEYAVEQPVHVNSTDDIYRERMPTLFYVDAVYNPHFYAEAVAAHYAKADGNVQEATQLATVAPAPYCLSQSSGPGCCLPTIVPMVESEAYIQQHYGGYQNIGPCLLPPGIPLESGQGSSSSSRDQSSTQTSSISRRGFVLKELALLPGCEVSGANDEDEDEEEEEEEHEQSSTIVDDVVCVHTRSGVGLPEPRRPAARARRGGSGFQSAHNLSLSLFQPHPASAQVPLVIPDPVKILTSKEKRIVVDWGMNFSQNEASCLAGASFSHHVPTRVASPPNLTVPNVRVPSPPNRNGQIIHIASDSRMVPNLSTLERDKQQTALKNSRFMKPMLEILQEVCHLPQMVQQARQRPGHLGHPAVRQTGVRSGVENEVFEPADPRIGSTHAAAPKKAKGNFSAVPSRVALESLGELETEKQNLLYMLEKLTKTYMLHTERLERLTNQFNAQAAAGVAEMYIAIVRLTLSRNFRAVKDAISRRLRAVQKALGEDIKFVCRAAHLGAIVPQVSNPWRLQRGLPEIAVGLLRGWLFEHFLHPYPKDKDKTELARQTGLSRSQVSNWFINARVRLWKPMVEEMYEEELMREEAEERPREARTEAERGASVEPIGKLLDMNSGQGCIEAENTDHTLMDDHLGQVGDGQQCPMQVGLNELGLIVYNGGESSSHQHEVELEVFHTMPEEFAHVDKRLRPGMPLKICKLEPKDT